MLSIPREIEVKIIHHVPTTLQEFEKLMQSVGATLVTPRRLLVDKRFRLKKFPSTLSKIEQRIFKNIEDMQQVLAYLGLAARLEPDSHISFALLSDTLPDRVARLRADGNSLILTIRPKMTAQEKQSRRAVVNRAEVEAQVNAAEPIEQLLLQLGYRLNAEREKFRTTYTLNDSLIEYTEPPLVTIPRWIEVEGPSEMHVLSVVKRLGFTLKDTTPMSEAQYLHHLGLPNSRIRRLKFADH